MSVESIEVLGDPSRKRWQPVVGPEATALLNYLDLPAESSDRLLEEAIEVLESCLPPEEAHGEETGLAVGYVQSGKTMSFTTVAALARDNGYAMVVVIAGTSVPLLGQSTKRLEQDLRLLSRSDWAWLHLQSEQLDKTATRDALRHTLADWHDPDLPAAHRRTVLITMMKQHTHLKKVVRALQGLSLAGLPVLVIDDEADQASLNTAVLQKRESTTYKRIKALRAAIPHHTYLQYTATPQAPLLINIIDTLSPRFAQVLTPGPDYVGGRHFFRDLPNLVSVIPEDELPDSGTGEPPESLRKALRLFFLGVAAGMLEGAKGNRSMMIHPSQQTAGHEEYHRWVMTIKESWRAILDPEGAYPDDRYDLLNAFQDAYAGLVHTVDDLPAFEALAKLLPRAVRLTVVEEINATRGRTPEIAWNSHYSWILVGGQAMDRGFTVEGLTVTYMPRGIGVGNADTVQQRARFFGYKRRYLGYCHIFLERAARDAFERYVEHEEDIRRRLQIHRQTGAPLTAWKRSFFLDHSLQPTRKSVLDLGYYRAPGESDWFWMRSPHDSTDAVAANRQVVKQFLERLDLRPDAGHPDRTPYVRHKVSTGLSLRFALEELLIKLHVTDPEDSAQFTLLQILLSEHLERDPLAEATVYEMSPEADRERDRSVNKAGNIVNLFQGAIPPKPSGTLQVGDVYPGDRELAKLNPGVTIQIHRLRIKSGEDTLATDVPTIAVHVPADASRPVLIQDQPGQAHG
jgi:hypothetical protein